jgi:UDP-N-acetylmuramoyl-L-alanyl-D-glutamate--2,6-diaminopimelate ligase
MRLGELIEGLATMRGGDPDQEVLIVTPDSRKVRPGAVFVAIPGLKTDGHRHIAEAVERGAIAVVGQQLDVVPARVAAIEVSDSRLALARLASRFFGSPSNEMLIVGITGTNGKTTTAYLVEALLEKAGWQVGLIGTVEYRWAGLREPAPHTTPEPSELQALLRRMRDDGCDAAVIEVSSHALEMGRIEECDVDLGVFTNLTQDHLDYHGSMERYFEAKARLFSHHLALPAKKRPRWAVVNTDDPRAAELLARTPCASVTYATRAEARVNAWEVKASLEGIEAEIVTPVGGLHVRSPLIGTHNVHNLLAAAAVGVALELPLETIRKGLSAVERVPGRMERVGEANDPPVFVDYAHTPDALDRALEGAVSLSPGGIIVVFGCGGDRDRTKRSVMGEVVARRASLAVVTSDNPRSEDPLSIIDDVLAGVRRTGGKRYEPDAPGAFEGTPGYVVIPDRREAIRLACRLARKDRIVVIAGKGHEDYQLIGRDKHPFDDRIEAVKALGAIRSAT